MKARKADEKVSHWRAKELTKQMRRYAADDAAAAAAVWWALVEATPEADRARLWTSETGTDFDDDVLDDDEYQDEDVGNIKPLF